MGGQGAGVSDFLYYESQFIFFYYHFFGGGEGVGGKVGGGELE